MTGNTLNHPSVAVLISETLIFCKRRYLSGNSKLLFPDRWEIGVPSVFREDITGKNVSLGVTCIIRIGKSNTYISAKIFRIMFKRNILEISKELYVKSILICVKCRYNIVSWVAVGMNDLARAGRYKKSLCLVHSFSNFLPLYPCRRIILSHPPLRITFTDLRYTSLNTCRIHTSDFSG